MVSDAKDSVIITATFSPKRNLGECQFCLTNIAGVDRLSLASITANYSNPSSTIAIFKAFGWDSSFLRAGIDCQGKSYCGFVTMTGLGHADITPSSWNKNGRAKRKSVPLCVLTDVQTTSECGICLKMASGSNMIQKFHLVTNDGRKYYLHVLYTMHSNIFDPCSSSGMCSGLKYEFGDGTCVNLVNKLSKYNFYSVEVDPLGNPNPDQANMLNAIRAIYETTLFTSSCYKTSAALGRRKECVRCMALYSEGMAVLLSDTTTAHVADQHNIETEQIVFLISNGSRRFIKHCQQLCGSIDTETKGLCLDASKTSISYSPTLGKIYYNMAVRDPWNNQILRDKLPLSQPSNCMWVEHELSYDEMCQTCLEGKAGFSVKRLSQIDFLVSSVDNIPTYSISGCISSISLAGQKRCKRMISVPNQFCNLYNLQSPELDGGSIPGSSQNDAFRITTIGRPEKSDSKCFICLTLWLDILITDLKYFLMVGAPKSPDCFEECGYIKMAQWQALDVSLIRPMSPNSIKARFGIMERYSFPYELILSDANILE